MLIAQEVNFDTKLQHPDLALHQPNQDIKNV